MIMTNDNNSFNHHNEGQVLLTYELLFLLQWIMEHEAEALKKIVTRSLKSGFNDPDFRNNELVEMHITDPSIHQCIVDFLGLLDALLIESTTELSMQKSVERNLIPALNHIDSTICDDETVQGSLKKASTQIHHHPEENPQEILFKELLKRWKPDKTSLSN
jgi:hypothetical protein